MAAVASLLFDFSHARQTPEVLELDAVLSQSHELPSDITEFPVETGSDPSDHIQPKAETFQLEGVVTEFRLGHSQEEQEKNRVKTAMATLVRIRDTGTLVSFRSQRRSLDSLGMANLKLSFDAKSGGSLRFSCTLKQVRIVSTRTVQIIRKRVGTPGAKNKVNEGSKASDRVPDSVVFGWLGDKNDTVSTANGPVGPERRFPSRFGVGG